MSYELADGRVGTVQPLLFGRGRLGVSTPENYARGYIDDEW